MQSEGFEDNFSLGKSMHLVGWKIITVFIIKLIFYPPNKYFQKKKPIVLKYWLIKL